MKKLKKTSVCLLMILAILFGLAGCMFYPSREQPNTQMKATVATNPTESTTADETLPEETQEKKENYTQPTVEETVPKETESAPRETEIQKEEDKTPVKEDPSGTEPTQGSTEPQPTVPNTEPPQETKPSTLPEETEPANIEETEPSKEQIDISMIENNAETYAQKLGFVVDNSLGKGNAGYYSPDYRPLYTTQEGCNAATDMVSATKNQLNSRFSEEYCETLVEEAYGYARVNCTVVFSHTDELGDWYYIYVFYG